MAIIKNISKKIRELAQSGIYGNAIYRAVLNNGAIPDHLELCFVDTWPGDVAAGQALIKNASELFGLEESEKTVTPRNILTHEWLRDLRTVGTETARRKARELVEYWLDNRDFWHKESWAHDVLGERLTNWVTFFDFFNPISGTDKESYEELSERLIASMMRQLRYLIRTMPVNMTGIESLSAIKGLIVAGLSLQEGKKSLGLAIELLQRIIATEILPDGGHITRNPNMQFQVLRYFIDIRDALRATKQEVPPELTTAIERMIPALKLFRHGDDGLALFNGGQEGNLVLLEAVIVMSEARKRVLRRLPQMGYERIAVGRSLLLVDVGAPPLKPFDESAHAGLLSFEFSVGRERIIVNCGAGPEGDADWRTALAATAAHSTLTLSDTNACEILPQGGIGHRPKQISAQRYEQDGVHYIEAAHDGYAGKHHINHHRTLSLSSDSEELRGRDVLSGAKGREFTLRWHLHPSIQASLLQGGKAALLRTPSGNGWRLRLDDENFGGDLGLESSVYCGGQSPRRTLQLKVSSTAKVDPTVISWVLAREKKQ